MFWSENSLGVDRRWGRLEMGGGAGSVVTYQGSVCHWYPPSGPALPGLRKVRSISSRAWVLGAISLFYKLTIIFGSRFWLHEHGMSPWVYIWNQVLLCISKSPMYKRLRIYMENSLKPVKLFFFQKTKNQTLDTITSLKVGQYKQQNNKKKSKFFCCCLCWGCFCCGWFFCGYYCHDCLSCRCHHHHHHHHHQKYWEDQTKKQMLSF